MDNEQCLDKPPKSSRCGMSPDICLASSLRVPIQNPSNLFRKPHAINKNTHLDTV